MSPSANSTRKNQGAVYRKSSGLASKVKAEEKLASLPIVKGTKRNFSQEEDLQICRSYIYYTIENKDNLNPKHLWKNIAQHFKESLSEEDFICQREKDSLKARWVATLDPRTREFSGCVHKTANNHDGSNYSYDAHKDSKFRFTNCFEYLKRYDRWNPNPTLSSERVKRRKVSKEISREDVYAAMMQSIDSKKEVEMSDIVALKFFNHISSSETGLPFKDLSSMIDLSSMTDLSLMLVDPTTIKQPKRRLWIEQKQAEILKRDNI
ncbi:hypothetical protein INT47_005841 [Mucor saturninus]|uniref:Uncharacterized protein n=1 Tax=Mucor saturninus TaxID=64648 RepID=A0A8H7QZF4_9FUNG|nr:hypothetical protein INT47_005841 [Mucor saturninus]